MKELKCKICGGKLEFKEGDSIGICDSCGTKQILLKLDNDRKVNLYDRADHYFQIQEYDRAMNLYEQILLEDSKDALAYWSIVLCRYGVEYIEDPQTKKRVPTIHRLQYQSLSEDEDYKKALENADENTKKYYEEFGQEIENIRRQILDLSKKEEPYDVFICYKESDNEGNRTKDSVLANELYYELKDQGFKVFFSRITLENKLGENYESCIFSALHTSKVMVVIGTKAEYLNSVWVKNEWSRYLELIRQGEKKTLIPAYRDMDPYDLPEEFSHLQALDMSKLGFMQDLIRGIEKLCFKAEKQEKEMDVKSIVEKKKIIEKVEPQEEVKLENLLKRIQIFLEYGEWEEANQYCEKALDQDPENAQIYLYKIMANLHIKEKKELVNTKVDLTTKSSYRKLMTYADPELAEEIRGYIVKREENIKKQNYEEAVAAMKQATTSKEFEKLREVFLSFKDEYPDAQQLAEECRRHTKIGSSGVKIFGFWSTLFFIFVLFLMLTL